MGLYILYGTMWYTRVQYGSAWYCMGLQGTLWSICYYILGGAFIQSQAPAFIFILFKKIFVGIFIVINFKPSKEARRKETK